MRVGWIGVGLLGEAMVERLLARGREVVAWNREPDSLARVAAKGAEPASSPAEVGRLADVVCLCVLDTAAVESVVFGPEGVLQGPPRARILVDHSTAMPEPTVRMAARLAEEAGMAWVDAPVSGGPGFAREGRLTLMVGGADEAVAAVQPLFGDLAANATHLGAPGAGQMAKVVNQAICGIGYVMLAEAVRLAEAAGLDTKRIPAALAGGHADGVLLRYAFPKMAARDFDPPSSLVRQMLKDLRNVEAEARRLDLSLPMLEAAATRFQAYCDAGGALRETASVIRLYEEGAAAGTAGAGAA
ncbi:MAG: NAD(P)-dependent oxidoreductase [Acetobacteraceae bacterium]